ncbi:toll/interleukin-1 receptor domain-containing protein [Enterococcus sp. AD013-P3]|uniref:toll/interleukin-1 receptor domain-containing protein n=1 Tax=Enterococcus sp. AD013-P3 TaxID=3411036 RepID=UPI003B92BA4F
MIFLSHNSKDKPIVEPLAIRLRDTFGQDNIFYDSWSIQPGDGIINQMNNGLDKCRFFFFFVSKNSLESKMVSMEWQNAVMKSAQDDVKIIPVRLDGAIMPTILLQTLYIDLFSNGLEVALKQMVDVVQGTNNFQPQNAEFHNLEAICRNNDNKLEIAINAKYYMEPKSSFIIVLVNTHDQVELRMKQNGMSNVRFFPEISLNNGINACGWGISVSEATVPGFPFEIIGESKDGNKINLVTVMHEVSQNRWEAIPTLIM